MKPTTHVRHAASYRWDGIPVLSYKEDGNHFRGITRQILFEGDGLSTQWRYFEVEAGGHSTLERHEHVHAVLILRGSGHCLVGNAIHDLATFDLVHVPPLTWHQFRATRGEPLGFLCLVPAERDKPQRPDAAALAELRQDECIALFIRA